jgi:hypothetical protein
VGSNKLGAELYPIPRGLSCIPSALVAITGLDHWTVIYPLLLDYYPAGGVKLANDGAVAKARDGVALDILDRLGFDCQAMPGGPQPLSAWSRRSEARYPARVFLISFETHVAVLRQGMVFDNISPRGCAGIWHERRDEEVEVAHWVASRFPGRPPTRASST